MTVHAADHGLGDGAAGVTFSMGEPADIIPPLVLSCFGIQKVFFRQAGEALHQSAAQSVWQIGSVDGVLPVQYAIQL